VSVLVHCERLLGQRPDASPDSADGVLNSVILSFVNSSVIAPAKASLEKNLHKWVESAHKFITQEFLLRPETELHGTPQPSPRKGVRGARKEVKQTLKTQITKSVGILPFVGELEKLFGSFLRAILTAKKGAKLPKVPPGSLERQEFAACVVGAQFSEGSLLLYKKFETFAEISDAGELADRSLLFDRR
jgi:hypothetical protein